MKCQKINLQNQILNKSSSKQKYVLGCFVFDYLGKGSV